MAVWSEATEETEVRATGLPAESNLLFSPVARPVNVRTQRLHFAMLL